MLVKVVLQTIETAELDLMVDLKTKKVGGKIWEYILQIYISSYYMVVTFTLTYYLAIALTRDAAGLIVHY